MPSIHYDIAHLLGACGPAAQLRPAVPAAAVRADQMFAIQSAALAAAAAWQGYIQDAPHLYVTAVLALGMKAIIIPWRCTG